MMLGRYFVAVAALPMVMGACSRQDRKAVSSAYGATPAAHDTQPQVRTTAPDTDLTVAGMGLPKGYIAQFDLATAKTTDVSYTPAGAGRWEVRTGAAHILYALRDTAHGHYTVTATLEQLQKPKHPESYGIFVGGSSLDRPATRRYTYFLVRGDGKYLVKLRDGKQMRTITGWTPHPAVPTEDAAGKGVYRLKIEVDGKAAKVSVNGQPVTTISAKDGPLDGIAGVRINHNLHVMLTPVTIVREH